MQAAITLRQNFPINNWIYNCKVVWRVLFPVRWLAEALEIDEVLTDCQTFHKKKKKSRIHYRVPSAEVFHLHISRLKHVS